MDDPAAGGPDPLVIGLPEGFGRSMRLGPFPSVRDALKFSTYAAIGAVFAAVLAPIWWLPFLGGGFALSVFRPDGRALDERLGAFVAFELRSGRRSSSGTPPRRRRAPHSPGNVVARASQLVGILTTGGIPVAFLPPPEARALFDRYRAFLGALEGGLYLTMGVRPMEVRPFRPRDRWADGGPAPTARAGYDEMVRLLCERRLQREVRIAVWVPRSADGSFELLERRLEAVSGHLAQLGLSPVRLRGRDLDAAAQGMGWSAPS